MTHRVSRPAKAVFAFIFVLFLVSLLASAQSVKMPDKYKPTRFEEYAAYCALWRTDASFHSTIRISNQLDAEIDATVTIYMADGTALDLPAVHLAKSSVDTLDVNAALAAAPDNVRSHISTYGSAAIRYRYDWQGAVYASMSILDSIRSLEYNYGFTFPPGQGVGEKHLTKELRALREFTSNANAYEGLWFRNGRNGGGFLSLANVSSKALHINMSLSGLRNPAGQKLSLAPHNTALVDLKEFFGEDETRTGGLTVTHNGPEGALQIAGGLEDLSTGYSASMPIAAVNPKNPHRAEVGERKYASVGLMVNEQDAVLGFPSGVKFWPYAFFRNLAASSRTLHFAVYYMRDMRGRQVQRVDLPDMTLQPGEARELAIHDLMLKYPEIPDINLVYSYTGSYSDILEGTGSTDSSGNYVFPVVPQPVAPSGAIASNYWLFGGGYDTMYTVWNPLDTPQDFLATLRYGKEGATYRMFLQLEPHASAMIDIGVLARNRMPDVDGNVIPLDHLQGTISISSTSEDPVEFITPVLSGGIYNPQKATCGNVCKSCDGFTGIVQVPSNCYVDVNGSQQINYYYVAHGSQYNITGGSNWNSQSTPIATVQTKGQTNPGKATGVALGNTMIFGQYDGFMPVNVDNMCWQGAEPPCPVADPFVSCPIVVQPPTCATPVNFTSTETNFSDGSLVFLYSFSSSTGNPNDLSSCTIGETVWYPTTADPYVWPLPMIGSSKNPTTPPTSHGNNLVMRDQNYPPTGYKSPYFYAHFQATQRLWWICPCYNNGQTNAFVPDITIDRKVFQDSDGKWKYRITKSGYTNTVVLP